VSRLHTSKPESCYRIRYQPSGSRAERRVARNSPRPQTPRPVGPFGTADLVLRSPRRRYSPDCHCSVDANRPQSDPPTGSRRRTGIGRRRRPSTTVRGNSGRPVPDLVARDFPASGPDELWGAYYLRADAGGRPVSGRRARRLQPTRCRLGHDGSLRTTLVLEVLDLASKQRDPEETVQHYEQEYRSREHSQSEPPRSSVAAWTPSTVHQSRGQRHFLLRGGCGLICEACGLEVSPNRTIYGGKSVHRPWTDECR